MKMTVSLISAYSFYMSCPPGWKDNALEGIKNTLTQGFTGSAATKRGEAYEEKINKALTAGTKLTGVEKPLLDLKGMGQQVWLTPFSVDTKYGKKPLRFTFRGKMDYIGKNADGDRWIADLKTTGSVIKDERYADSIQHHVYCCAMEIEYFTYYVLRFDNEAAMKPAELRIIPIDLSGFLPQSKLQIKAKIDGLVHFLHDMNLWDDYFTKFNGGKE